MGPNYSCYRLRLWNRTLSSTQVWNCSHGTSKSKVPARLLWTTSPNPQSTVGREHIGMVCSQRTMPSAARHSFVFAVVAALTHAAASFLAKPHGAAATDEAWRLSRQQLVPNCQTNQLPAEKPCKSDKFCTVLVEQRKIDVDALQSTCLPTSNSWALQAVNSYVNISQLSANPCKSEFFFHGKLAPFISHAEIALLIPPQWLCPPRTCKDWIHKWRLLHATVNLDARSNAQRQKP